MKCAVTLELLATMLAQKEVLATAQTHEAQEGAGGHRRLEKVHVRGCAQHHEPERNKRVRHAFEAAAEDRRDGCLSARVLRHVIGLHAIAP